VNCRSPDLPPSASPEIAWNKSLAMALHTTLRRNEKLMQRCAKKITFRRVHTLRVETRRLLAQVTLAGNVSAAVKGKSRQALKRTLRVTAGMSDAYAQILMLEDVAPGHPELKSFARHLLQRQRRAIEFAERKLQRPKPGTRLLRLARALREPPDSHRARPMLRQTLRKAILALADFTAAKRCDPIGLHRARLAVKNVRYMAESLQSALPPSGAAWIEGLQRRQRLMGRIHDLDLFAIQLAKYVAKRRPASGALQPVQTLLARRRLQLVRRYRAQRFPSPPTARWFQHGENPRLPAS